MDIKFFKVFKWSFIVSLISVILYLITYYPRAVIKYDSFWDVHMEDSIVYSILMIIICIILISFLVKRKNKIINPGFDSRLAYFAGISNLLFILSIIPLVMIVLITPNSQEGGEVFAYPLLLGVIGMIISIILLMGRGILRKIRSKKQVQQSI